MVVVADSQQPMALVDVERLRIALVLEYVEKDVRRATGAMLRVDHPCADELLLLDVDEDEEVFAQRSLDAARERIERVRDQLLEHGTVVRQVHRIEVCRDS